MRMDARWVAYAESVGAGAVVAGLAAAYQATGQGGAVRDWAPVASAFLVGAMGYLLAALRWLQTPPPPPPGMSVTTVSTTHGAGGGTSAPLSSEGGQSPLRRTPPPAA